MPCTSLPHTSSHWGVSGPVREPLPHLRASRQAKQCVLRALGRGELGSISSPGEPKLLKSEQGLLALRNRKNKLLHAACCPHTGRLASH